MVTLPLFETSLETRSLTVDPPMTDAELESLCLRSDNVQIERTREGVIRVNPPTGGFTGNGNFEILRQLGIWWDTHRRGRVFDSNTGFFLLDGSLLSPDAAYLPPEQLAGLTKAELARMPRLCPAFVMELLSQSDSLAETRKKMECWVANGARLAWLVDPFRRCIEVYGPGAAPVIDDSALVPGSGPVEGFVLDAAQVWECYEV
jgi:Uma2 family endonuclease